MSVQESEAHQAFQERGARAHPSLRFEPQVKGSQVNFLYGIVIHARMWLITIVIARRWLIPGVTLLTCAAHGIQLLRSCVGG